MKDLYPYSVDSLQEMFGLRKGDIHSMIKSEGVPVYSTLRNGFIGYLPSLGSAFKLDYATELQVYENIKPAHMSLTMSEPLITVTTVNRSILPTSYLFQNVWLEEASKLLDVDNEDFSLLVSKNIDAPFFCGHDKPIRRLGMNLENDVKIIKVKHFIKGWK